MKNAPGRKGQYATEDSVKEACDDMFRRGEKITEATVRARLGGGSPNVILQHMRTWERSLRDRHLLLESELEQYKAGDRPPGVPDALWMALKPVWDQLLADARTAAERRLEGDRQALAATRAQLAEEAERVREADALWQEEKQSWAGRIDALNAEIERRKAKLATMAEDLIRLGHELTAKTTEAQALQAQVEQAQVALANAQAGHQADLERWAQQVDDARQEARKSSARINELQAQLTKTQGDLSDLRIAHERLKIEADAAKKADARSQDEIRRLREDLNAARKALPAAGQKTRTKSTAAKEKR